MAYKVSKFSVNLVSRYFFQELFPDSSLLMTNSESLDLSQIDVWPFLSSIRLAVKKIMDGSLSSRWFFANSTIPISQNPSLNVKPGGALDSTKSFTEGSWEQSSILLSAEGHFALFALVTGWKGTSLKSGHTCLPPPLGILPIDEAHEKEHEVLGLSILELWLLRRRGIGEREGRIIDSFIKKP